MWEAGAGPRSPQHPEPGPARFPKPQVVGDSPRRPGPHSFTYSRAPVAAAAAKTGVQDRQRRAAGCGQ